MTPLLSLPDLLVFLPYHVGFRLRDALVVVALQGPRLALVERVDLPDAEPLPPEAVAVMLGGLRRLPAEADLVLVVAFVGDHAPEPAHGHLTRAVEEIVPVVRALVVEEDHWREREDLDRHPLPDAADVPLVAEYVGRGVAPLPDRAALRRALDPAPAPDTVASVAALVADGVHEWSALLAWERVVADGAPADVATVLALLSDVGGRDLLLGRLVPSGPTVEASSARSQLPVETTADVGASDALARQTAVRAALVRVVRAAPPHLRATALSVLAVWAWSVGDGAMAAVAAAAALDHEPGHSLADLATHLVRLGIPPPVAR